MNLRIALAENNHQTKRAKATCEHSFATIIAKAANGKSGLSI